MAKYKATRNFIVYVEKVDVDAKHPEGLIRHKAVNGKTIEVSKSVIDDNQEFIKKGWLIPVDKK
jgi:hypothetical protein